MKHMGNVFRAALSDSKPLQIVGVMNAYCAMMAEQAGFKAIYLSGAGVANASLGLPDVGMTSLQDVVTDALRITQAVDLPLLVDIDTGFGNVFSLARSVNLLEEIGVAAVHLEDQIMSKRCGHRPNKKLISIDKMTEKIAVACQARKNEAFVIMARTDALGIESIEETLARIYAYVDAGADMIFLEAPQSLEQYQEIKQSIDVPILANMTEFGATPLYDKAQLSQVGIDMILYPLSGFRAASRAVSRVYEKILISGTQRDMLDTMQTRDELYHVLDYYKYEKYLDKNDDE